MVPHFQLPSTFTFTHITRNIGVYYYHALYLPWRWPITT
ncbi:hypothetical protein GBAR_LOCUS11665, partial [Geodia barretti]